MFSDKLRVWGAWLFGALFLGAAVAENIPGVSLPLAGLRLYNDWNMFARPGPPSVVLVTGRPKEGGEPVMLVNPIERPATFIGRLRDARQAKLHEAMYKPYSPIAAKQSYLAYLCREWGDRYSQIELRARAQDGSPGALVAERACQ